MDYQMVGLYVVFNVSRHIQGKNRMEKKIQKEKQIIPVGIIFVSRRVSS